MTINRGDLVVPFHVFCRGVSVVAGEHDRTVTSGIEQTRTIESVTPHPNYSGQNNDFRHDICVIQVAEPFEMNGNVAAIGLADSEIITGTNCTVSGWGAVGVCKILNLVNLE